jgi:dimeric dUTPase (all-alpha-NTP-PPase superfamily)
MNGARRMDFTKLFETQKVLDAEIVRKHPVDPNENRLRKKVLAALTEVGECANEFPEIFKFWSKKKNNVEKGMVEFVDILHFLLSIGLERDRGFIEVEDMPKSYDAVDCLTQLCFEISCIEFVEEAYTKAFQRLVELSEVLGFTWEQVESAYMSKNQINHERQANGY